MALGIRRRPGWLAWNQSIFGNECDQSTIEFGSLLSASLLLTSHMIISFQQVSVLVRIESISALESQQGIGRAQTPSNQRGSLTGPANPRINFLAYNYLGCQAIRVESDWKARML